MKTRSIVVLAAACGPVALATLACGNSPPPAPPPQPSATAALPPPVDSAPPVASADAGPPVDSPPAGSDIAVTILAKGQHATSALAADESGVYWVEDQDGIVTREPKRGGAMMMFYSSSSGAFAAPSSLALDEAWVFWTEHVKQDPASTVAVGRVMKQDKNGGQPVVVAQGIRDALTSLAVDATDVYWISGGQIMGAAKAGGGGHPITFKLPDPTSVASDGKLLYITQASSDDKAKPGGALRRATTRPGAKIETLASGLDKPTGVLVDAAAAYWIEGGTKVASLPKKGGGAPKILAEVAAGVVDLAIDDTYVYFLGGDGTVARAAKDGSTPAQTLATGQTNPVGIAVDRTNVFWSTRGTEANKFHDGTVATLVKP